MLQKQGGSTAIAFAVSEGYWKDDAHMASFEAVVKAVAPVVGGLPVTLRLDNTDLATQKEVVVH